MNAKPIAVCIIVENLPVPFDRRVWQEARALREAGYQVSVICPKGRGFEARRETREGIEIYRHWLWEASGPLGYFLEYTWALAAEFWLALRVYARTRFRVLQTCNPPDTIFLIGLFFKLFGVRFIFDHHDLNPELYEAKFRRRGLGYRLVCLAERLTFRTADVAIATNESYRDVALTRGGMRRERTFVVRSCPDLNRIQRVAAQPALKEGRPYLVAYLGVMGPQDGIDLLLDSIAVIAKQWGREDVLFALVGSGAELPRLKALASSQGLDPVVRFAGHLSDEEVATYLSTADVGVAPDPATAMNDKSTMNKILEYMAYGLPVVLFDLTEGRRSAADAALYAQRDDPEDFARKIVNLLDSENLRQQLGARGRRRIEESLNWAIEKRALLEAYSTALGGG
ncbi:MAG TPA: glycosyltransferase family 4 protein [Terriglobia bacterium]|nr:glycosyltransferase family 4 protein [Terriglobia bacterium]